jgi:predicted TIM-barrel fold metal-dependent hydrolase
MTLTDEMPALRRERRARIRVIDCDIRHALRTQADLRPYLSRRWREHLDQYGCRQPAAAAGGEAWPPGSDLDLLRARWLDRHAIEAGLLHLEVPLGADERNQELGAALCRALNEWTVAHWTGREARLKAAIMVPAEDAEAAVAEIERWGRHPGFVAVAMATRSIEPLGRRRYWPVYDAAARHHLPVALRAVGDNFRAASAAGWPGTRLEERHAAVLAQQAAVVSLVTEGVFELYSSLRVVVLGAGWGWVPSLCWRFDRHWARMRDEVPHLTDPPSATIRRHFWFATQPTEVPERAEDLRRALDWLGCGRLLFAGGYPHRDMDDPEQALPVRLSEEERRAVFGGNARAVYGLG